MNEIELIHWASAIALSVGLYVCLGITINTVYRLIKKPHIPQCVKCKYRLTTHDDGTHECGNRMHTWLFCRVFPKDYGCAYFER